MLKRVYLAICVCSPYLLLIEVEADLRLWRLGEDFIPETEDQKTAIILTQADRPLPMSPPKHLPRARVQERTIVLFCLTHPS